MRASQTIMELLPSQRGTVGEAGVIPADQFAILLELAEMGPSTTTELQKAFGINLGRTMSILKRAEGRGWIQRSKSRADRRHTEISLTPKAIVFLRGAKR